MTPSPAPALSGDRAPVIGRRPIFVLGILSLGFWVGLAHAGDLTTRIPVFLLLYGILFAAYVALIILSRAGDRLASGHGLKMAIAFAALFRLAAIQAPPSLSTDLYRYLWDGRVILTGVNPYRYAPEALELAPLRDEYHAAINNSNLPTIYPPIAQFVFAATAAVWPHPTGIKVAMAIADLMTVAALASLLAALQLRPGRLIVYAWCPLPILEFAGMGHVDIVGILFLVSALAALARNRCVLALAALGLSILSKIFPVILVPLFLGRTPPRTWVVLGGVLVLSVLPFLAPGVDPSYSLRTYVATWRGNDVLFAGLLHITGHPATAKAAALVVIALVALACLRRGAAIETTVLAMMTATLLLAPVLHPWYVTWLVPFLAVRPNPAGIAWTGTVALAYLAWTQFHESGIYTVEPWPRVLQLLIPLAVAVGWHWRGMRGEAQKGGTRLVGEAG